MSEGDSNDPNDTMPEETPATSPPQPPSPGPQVGANQQPGGDNIPPGSATPPVAASGGGGGDVIPPKDAGEQDEAVPPPAAGGGGGNNPPKTPGNKNGNGPPLGPVDAKPTKFLLWGIVFLALVGLVVVAAQKGSVAGFLFAVAALVAYFTLLWWPWYGSAWRWVTSTSVATLSLVLSLSGAAGGFAYHLVHNHGGVYLVGFHEVIVPESFGVEPPGSTPVPQPSPTSTATTTSAPGTPAADTSPTPPQLRPKLPQFSVKKHVFDLGFLSDLLVGLIAANALHLAISGIIKYDDPDRTGRNNVYFTLIALGILAGFSGANVLPSWANKLLGPEQQQALVNQLSNKIASDPAQRTAVAAEVTQQIKDNPAVLASGLTKVLSREDSLKLLQQLNQKPEGQPEAQSSATPSASPSASPPVTSTPSVSTASPSPM